MITLSRHKQKLFVTWYKINEYVVTLQSETIVKVITNNISKAQSCKHH